MKTPEMSTVVSDAFWGPGRGVKTRSWGEDRVLLLSFLPTLKKIVIFGIKNGSCEEFTFLFFVFNLNFGYTRQLLNIVLRAEKLHGKISGIHSHDLQSR